DATRAILDGNPELYSKCINRPSNGGKGAAVRDGLLAATGDYILFQDADLEYDPSDYGRLLKPILEQQADVVVGSRNLAPDFVRVHYFWHLLGNKTITLLFNFLNNLTFTDIYSCYLLYRRNLVEPAKLKDDGWAQHAEILGTVARRAKVIYEVPVNYAGRTYDEGKKIRYWHVISVIWMILRTRFSVL
ncbi:MAG: glycosyltransferase family 2 protein, partial [Rickettsiales bacterium]